MNLFVGIAFAVFSGLSGTLAAIVVSLPAHYAKVNNEELSRASHFVSIVANLIFTGMMVGFQVVACSQGPVAIIFPLQVASSLFSNMVLQGCLKLSKLTNSSVVGTCVMVVAVLLLPDIGPTARSDDSEERIIDMLMTRKAIAFVSISLLVNAVCLTALLRKEVTQNMAMLFAYALVGGTGTVLNTSIQKLLTEDIPATGILLLTVVWVVLSIECLASGAMANGTLADPSKFVPISNGVNLVLNCGAGLCIWGDGPRLAYPFSYGMIYILVVLGTYLVSSLDVFSMVKLSVQHAVVTGAKKVASGKQRIFLGDPATVHELTMDHESTDRLLGSLGDWPHLQAGIALLDVESLPDFEERLEQELEKHMISNAEVAALCARMLEKLGGLGSGNGRASLEEWVAEISS